MQPVDESNFDGLINRWYQAAETKNGDTTFKMELYKDTDSAALTLERLIDKGSITQAKDLANIILHSFDSHKSESEGLISWVGANTLKWGKDVTGAYQHLHRLFEALQAANIVNPSPSEGSKKTYTEVMLHLFESLFGKNLSARDDIDPAINLIDPAAMNLIDSAAMYHLENNDKLNYGHKDGDPVIPNDILNLIFDYTVRKKPVKDSMALRQASKKVSQQAASVYQVPLTELKIFTADKAIEYAKEFGKELHYLNISNINFSDSNKLKELIKHLPKLTIFVANKCNLSSEGAEIIASSENMKNLKTLYLDKNRIGDEGLKHFLSSKYIKNLIALSLYKNQISNEGVKHLTISENMKNLMMLNLEFNQIGNEGVKDIAFSEYMKNLIRLNLSRNYINNEGVKNIALSKYMNNLKMLDVSLNQVNFEGIQQIHSSENTENIIKIYF